MKRRAELLGLIILMVAIQYYRVLKQLSSTSIILNALYLSIDDLHSDLEIKKAKIIRIEKDYLLVEIGPNVIKR